MAINTQLEKPAGRRAADALSECCPKVLSLMLSSYHLAPSLQPAPSKALGTQAAKGVFAKDCCLFLPHSWLSRGRRSGTTLHLWLKLCSPLHVAGDPCTLLRQRSCMEIGL